MVAKANRVRKRREYCSERAGWEGEKVNRLRSEQNPGVWHSGGLQRNSLEGEMWVETITEGVRRFIVVWRKVEIDAARHRQEKREATRLEKLLSYTTA